MTNTTKTPVLLVDDRQENLTALEALLEDRELERQNYELEQMNKAFVGRELRMVELKKRIKELEQTAWPR